MTRPYVFGTNFKMNQTPPESAAFYRQLSSSLSIPQDARIFIFPPFTSLDAVTQAAKNGPANLWIGAQNVYFQPDGAFTGEISLRMLLELGIDIVLLGHAERRQIFQESDADLNKKVRTVLEGGLRILLGVGETAEERGYGVSNETILRQLKIGLHGVEPAHLARVNVAYEPVWSIGAGGTPATPADVEPIAATIRETLGDLFGTSGTDVPILYGGSVDPKNAGTFTALPDVDGLLVGRAGWTVDGFVATFASGLVGYQSK